jgi:hypothetical protein
MKIKGKQQFILVALAILILAVAATPALAWCDEGAAGFQASTTMTTSAQYRAFADDAGDSATPEYPLGLLRAEGW